MSESSKKIKTIADIAKISEELRANGKKIVLCHGVFDLVHPGHIRHFEEASREGDVLIISVTPDPYVNRGPGRPVFPQELRSEVLASLAIVDYVVINEWPTATETIRRIKPSIYAKGNDYKDRSKDLTGKIYEEENALKEFGGKIVFTDEITFSSSSLANNLLNPYPQKAQTFLRRFRERVTSEEIIQDLNNLSKCKVLVIGDTIIDEYEYCSPMGKSPKENVIVTKFESNEVFAGGVLAAANHVSSLCEQVDLITCLGGKESREEFILSHLKKNVTPTLFVREDAPTTIKRRFVEHAYIRKLFEICFMNNADLPEEIEKSVFNHLDRILPNYDLVLVTDFGHGMLTPRLIDLICKKARFLAVNAQTNSSNIGFNLVTKYPRADYVCIDAPEARLALHDRISDMEVIIKRLMRQLDARFVSITLGHSGCIVFSKDEGVFEIPAFTQMVTDTVGAGDAFLSISAPCVANNIPIEKAGFIGNAAGAMKVKIVGNRSSIEKAALLKYLTTLLK